MHIASNQNKHTVTNKETISDGVEKDAIGDTMEKEYTTLETVTYVSDHEDFDGIISNEEYPTFIQTIEDSDFSNVSSVLSNTCRTPNPEVSSVFEIPSNSEVANDNGEDLHFDSFVEYNSIMKLGIQDIVHNLESLNSNVLKMVQKQEDMFLNFKNTLGSIANSFSILVDLKAQKYNADNSSNYTLKNTYSNDINGECGAPEGELAQDTEKVLPKKLMKRKKHRKLLKNRVIFY
ncbi:uncharacterized protein LOC135058169 [Pseudophryne corroboree]|uniref:uncharacterized protein LOC135058169 n=1 Tax=Pseudophryne corroboree TaxID=495146 RepID=UPI0030814D2C